MTTNNECGIERDTLFDSWDASKIWQKYCGFLDLSLEEFMDIQRRLLMEQVQIAAGSTLWKKLALSGLTPTDANQFRQVIPLTSYADYVQYLSQKQEDPLPEKPCAWAHTSGTSGAVKWVPYTTRAYGKLADATIASFILSAARSKGDVRITNNERVLLNLAARPYVTGHMAFATSCRILFRSIPPLEKSETMDFHRRIEEGFKISLRTGVDFAASFSSVLAKIGDSFVDEGRRLRPGFYMLHPAVMLRLIKAWTSSKAQSRPVMPKDLWPMKGIVCGGMDTSFYKEKILRYWGHTPLEIYATSEGSFLAIQDWTKSSLNFIPYSNFFEFIPEREWLRSREDSTYQPQTVLLDEVEAGRRYELVITNFYGMPFMRYRIGDLVKITTLRNDETGIRIPQMSFESRADDIIDIGGFTRLNEKTVWQAMNGAGINCEEWTLRKEFSKEQPIIHIYLELKRDDQATPEQLEAKMDDKLRQIDSDYNDLVSMLGLKPLRVTLLSRGTFERYLAGKRKAGVDLGRLKPKHFNPPEHELADLVRLSRET